MPAKTNDQFMRHETSADEETFRESRIQVTPKAGKKGKRSVEDMMASLSNPPAQALYALERIAKAEDNIVQVLKLAMPETLELIFKQRPSLKRYAPENEE